MSPRVLLVDDEPLARQRVRELLAGIEGYVCQAEADSGEAALATCADGGIDIVLLDLRMPGLDGLETARRLARLPVPPAIVFLTACDDRAIEALDAGAADYLLKPVRRERLAQALTRARRLNPVPAQGAAETEGPRRHFPVRRAGNLRLVPVDQVRCLRAEDKYVCLLCSDGEEHLIEESLVAIEREFGQRFLRIHRNCLVATAHIRGLERGRDGVERVRVDDLDQPLEVSRRNLAAVRAHLLRS